LLDKPYRHLMPLDWLSDIRPICI